MPLISIIIPVFNAERYLLQCLDSVLNQKYCNWECLLIDDGSIDGSTDICDDYCGKDSRFRVFHLPRRGVSAARNWGIDNASGAYLCFVDADDWIDDDYLFSLASDVWGSDWILSGQIREFQDGRIVSLIPQESASFTISPENTAAILSLESRLLFYAPHEKLYKSEIIRKNAIRFPENCSYGEDLIFNYLYLEHIQTISTLAVSGYHYRIHDHSLSSCFRPNQFDEDYHQWRIVKQFHEKKNLWNEDVEKYLAKRLWGIVYDGIFLYPKLENPPKNYLKYIFSIPEILVLRKYQDLFLCSSWIKTSIVFRLVFVFRLYFGTHPSIL